MQFLRQDLLLGLRSLRKAPASAIITSLTLALGIGLCTISWSLLYGVFFRGLDIPEAKRVIIINRSDPAHHRRQMPATEDDFHDWVAQQKSFEGLGHFSTGTINVSNREGPERFDGGFVSANVFDLLRVRPILGSTFRPGDDGPGSPLTVVLGYDAWMTRFKGDRGVVGTSVIVNGESATILGVMPKGFEFPESQKLWIAARDTRSAHPGRKGGPEYQVFGRLRPGVGREQAEREMALIADRLAQAYPETNKGITTRFQTFVEDSTGPELLAVFGAMQVATLFVLLIAIANVANLLLARATLRTREAAVRSALGATRLRVVLPFFAETLLLAAVGAGLGLLIAWFGVARFDAAVQGVGKPYFMVFRLDLPVLAFVAGITTFTALLAGAAPAFYILRTDVNVTLKDEVRGSSGVLGGRFTKVLVVAEIALSCALLIGAGLMVRSITRLRNFQYPYTTERMFTARVGLFETEYPTPDSRRGFFRALLARLETMPGVASAALTTQLPVNSSAGRIALEGQVYGSAEEHPRAQQADVSPGFFRTLEVTLRQGRDFTAADDAAAPLVAIVNEPFARKFFPGREALGQRFAEMDGEGKPGPWRTIVGVVPDLRMQGFDVDEKEPWGYYIPLAQRDPRFVSLALRSTGPDPLALTPAVRELVRSLNPNLPIYNVDSIKGVIRLASWYFYVFGTLFIVFGIAALFMATVGLYGVLSFSVSRRVKEMGIRMALGANAGDVIRLVLRQGGKQLGIGLGLGLLAAFGLTRVIGMLMFEVAPRDPPVFTLVVLTIMAVGVLASLVPATRATRVEPTAALRSE